HFDLPRRTPLPDPDNYVATLDDIKNHGLYFIQFCKRVGLVPFASVPDVVANPHISPEVKLWVAIANGHVASFNALVTAGKNTSNKYDTSFKRFGLVALSMAAWF